MIAIKASLDAVTPMLLSSNVLSRSKRIALKGLFISGGLLLLGWRLQHIRSLLCFKTISLVCTAPSTGRQCSECIAWQLLEHLVEGTRDHPELRGHEHFVPAEDTPVCAYW